jgi:hypothetical protein
MAAVGNPRTIITVSLDGLSGSSTYHRSWERFNVERQVKPATPIGNWPSCGKPVASALLICEECRH